MTESPPSAFRRLLERQPTPAQRERLAQLRDELALAEHDALWSLLELVEGYYASLLQRQNDQPSQPTSSSTGKPWRLLALAIGGQVLLLAGAMYVGARAANGGAITWSSCGHMSEPQNWIALILGAPAGWLALACAVPTLAHVARVGWRVRAQEPLVGWIISSTSALTAAGLAGLLLWLL